MDEMAIANEILGTVEAPAPAATPAAPVMVDPQGNPAPVDPTMQAPVLDANGQPVMVDPTAAPVPADPTNYPYAQPPTAPAAPQMTPEMYAQMMDERLAPIQEQFAAQNAPAPTEEELAIAQLKEQLGLTGIEEQNKALQDQIKQQEEYISQQQQAAAQAQMQQSVDRFKSGKVENAEQIVMDEINKIYQTDPQRAIAYQNDPMAWDYIYQAKIGASQPQAQPDPIVGTGNSASAPSKTAFDRAAQGEKVSQIDFGLDLLETARG